MSDSEPSVRDLFLDTTAQFNRHSRDAHSKQEIEELLSSARITGSSTYARLEFKMSFLQDLAYLHGKLRTFRSIPDVLTHLARLHPAQGRKLRRTLNHLARFWQNIPGDDRARIDAVLLSIEQQTFTIWNWFDQSVDYLADGTGCIRSTEAPRLHRGHLEVILRRCSPDRIRCRIHKFFQENRDSFQGMASYIGSLADDEKSAELRSLEQITAQASSDPTVLCDDRVCRKIGDALIGTDGKPFPEIVSSNVREFNVICSVLGKRLVQISPS